MLKDGEVYIIITENNNDNPTFIVGVKNYPQTQRYIKMPVMAESYAINLGKYLYEKPFILDKRKNKTDFESFWLNQANTELKAWRKK